MMVAACLLLAADWGQFRGPNGSGVSADVNLPVVLNPDRNVVWKTALPPGYSSPSVAGDRVFVTAVEDEKLFTICLDRATGRILWRREAPRTALRLVSARQRGGRRPSSLEDVSRRVCTHAPLDRALGLSGGNDGLGALQWHLVDGTAPRTDYFVVSRNDVVVAAWRGRSCAAGLVASSDGLGLYNYYPSGASDSQYAVSW